MNSRNRPLLAVATVLLVLPAAARAEPQAGAPVAPTASVRWPEHPADAPEERRSTGMMVSGIILTSCGILNGATGVAVLIGTTQCDGELCVFPFLAGLGFSGVGAALLGVGIPLWVVGASEPDPESERAASMPAVTLGPGSVSARWAF